jgi:hypothetical protein
VRRSLIAAALVAALALPLAGAAPSAYAYGSCSSQALGSATFTNCYDSDRGYTSATSQHVGDTTFTNIYNQDRDGHSSYGNSTTQRIGDSSFTSVWP